MTTLTNSEIATAEALAAKMVKDGVSPEQFAANAREMIEAYAAAQERTNSRMIDAYLTIPAARQAIIDSVYDVCTA